MEAAARDLPMQAGLTRDVKLWPTILQLAEILTSEANAEEKSAKVKDIGLGSMQKSALNELLVLATKYGHGMNVHVAVYNPTPDVHLNVLKTLLRNGADVSVVFGPETSASNREKVRFAHMFERHSETENPLPDIKLFIQHGVLSVVSTRDLVDCILNAVRWKNLAGLRILVDNRCYLRVMTEPLSRFLMSEAVFEMFHEFRTQDIALVTDCRILSDVLDGKNIGRSEMDWDAVELHGVMTCSCDMMTIFPTRPFNPSEYESTFDFLLAKGHLCPSSDVLSWTFSNDYPLLFTLLYICFRRDIPVPFPNIDLNLFQEEEYRQFEPKAAGIIAEMIRRTGRSVPESFMEFLDRVSGQISGKADKVQRLLEMTIVTVRKLFLKPEKNEKFSDSIAVLHPVPVKPALTLALPPNVMLPESVRAKVLFKDLHIAFHGYAAEWNWA